MPNPNTVELKAFIPSRDFALSQAFYQDVGFKRKFVGDGIAYFAHAAWNGELQRRGIAEQYQMAIGDLTQQPWRMLDFTLTDPSGVLWRIAQNL
ncbi:hypothetical protein [Chromobacterium violaceum]|uniref:Glyoxalase n=1 Tax=Chromobacterium violaceum (strain ATCC 12472 / DSM 30191 / JCM 1249 / CCUG 213 / NBRC 12614 / NCIMB 9131 / NCTC 9757 / MK) TaxID=243365 RepID=Q7NSP1_CHRVO|nr:hypothetical protein [Chromobacterium violaceum]AAQ61043.1 conserved hypothetical protein [Chromobacterium violaceum ATCC 12472]SUX39511.1 Uncharacterised protein [Chromobacterium violaceum]